MSNLVFGSYVTSATFCLKLGKTEIAALARFKESEKVRESTDPALWSLAAKGLIQRDNVEYSDGQRYELSEPGKSAVQMLKQAGLI